jgi:exopolyphosphatase/guanosine-5'-triphosphate,3'-diphosphate pyrophosphatase
LRVAVVDIGTNSTRLLVADVRRDGERWRIDDVERRTTVTRLGHEVDRTGRLAQDAMARVLATLDDYRAAIDALRVDRAVGVLTSAVRDAANGGQFTQRVARDYRLDARMIDGDEEARLTFLGATSARSADAPAPVAVIDIGGGSTELVVGSREQVTFHVSTQAGVVRHSERYLRHDPPRPQELEALAQDVRGVLAAGVPAGVRASVAAAIAVAGTPTSLAAIDQELDRYDPRRIEGYTLSLTTCESLLERLAAVPEAARREIAGLHPDRAPTIVAGTVMLVEAMRLFHLQSVEVSENDILRGAALRSAGASTFV